MHIKPPELDHHRLPCPDMGIIIVFPSQLKSYVTCYGGEEGIASISSVFPPFGQQDLSEKDTQQCQAHFECDPE